MLGPAAPPFAAAARPLLVARADEAPFDTVFLFALRQIPLYMLPALPMPFYRRTAAAP